MVAGTAIQELNVRELIRQPEGPTLEFKSYTPDTATLTQLLSAFANSDGGTLVVGVREGGEVVGANMNRLVRVVTEAEERVRPRLHVRLDPATVDGKEIGFVRISPSTEAPVFADAGVYVRHGTAAVAMSAGELEHRLRNAEQPPDQGTLATAIANQTLLIETLRKELWDTNGWRSKLKDYIIGGVIGTILGVIASMLLK